MTLIPIGCVVSLGNGWTNVEVYNVDTVTNAYTYSLTNSPTWDTSTRDRTQDALNYTLQWHALQPAVYLSHQAFYDANGGTWSNGGKFYIGYIDGYVRDRAWNPPCNSPVCNFAVL